MNKALAALVGGAGIGTGIAYLRHCQGRRGRHSIQERIQNKMTKAAGISQKTFEKTSREISSRASGMAYATSRLFHRKQEEMAPDALIKLRVRSKIGHTVSYPAAIYVSVHDGHVTLSGPVLSDELRTLMWTAWSVPGVKHVENRLTEHSDSSSILAALQSEGRYGSRPIGLRALTGIAGGALAVYGLSRRGRFGTTAGALGAGLLRRMRKAA